jgi:hypothetical protein
MTERSSTDPFLSLPASIELRSCSTQHLLQTKEMRRSKHCLLALILASMQVPNFKYLAKDPGDGQPERRPAPTPQGHKTASTGSLETGNRLVAQPNLTVIDSLATDRPPSTQPQAANAHGQLPPKLTYNRKTVPLPASMSPFLELEEGGMRYKCLPCTHVQKADVFINARQQLLFCHTSAF